MLAFCLLFVLNALCSGSSKEVIGYRVQYAQERAINTIFECRTSVNCISVDGSYLLNAKFVMINGRAQKQWYITDKLGRNLYGAAELSANPWSLKDWKNIVGPNDNHRYEPQMKMFEIHGDCDEWIGSSSEWDSTSLVRLSERMWLSLSVLQFKASFDEKRSVSISNDRKTCATIMRNMIQSFNGDYNEGKSLVHYSYCDYLSAVSSDLALDCFKDVYSKVNSSYMSEKWNAQENPLVCYNLLTQLGSSNFAFYRCLIQTMQYRALQHTLIQNIDPVRTLDTISALAGGNFAEARNVRSLKLVACFLLGLYDQTCHGISGHETDLEGADCSYVLLYAQTHVSNEAVHNLFQKVCMLFDKRGVDVSRDDALSTSVSVIFSLLDVGAVEMASLHVHNLVIAVLNMPDIVHSDVYGVQNTALERLRSTTPGMSDLSFAKELSNHRFHELALEKSGNVRGALLLYETLSLLVENEDRMRAFTAHGDLMSSFLNVLFQVCSPVILELPHIVRSMTEINNASDWMSETVILRVILVRSLDLLVSHCSASAHCTISDPFVVGRGLFLLAYQGVGLINGLISNTSLSNFLHDDVVPSKYNQLMRLVDRHFPWRFEKSHHESNMRCTTWEDGSQSCNALSTKRPRVGFLSFFLTRHSVGRLLAKIIAQVSQFGSLDVFIITKQQQSSPSGLDDVTQFLQRSIPSSRWISIPKDIPTAVAAVRNLQLDVLVFGDAFMESFLSYLAMFRMSRTQVIFWGHPYTTGYSESMDYFITSDSFESPTTHSSTRQEKQFSEQLLRLDSLSFQMFPAEELTVTVESVLPVGSAVIWPDIPTASAVQAGRLYYLRWVLGVSTDIHGVAVDSDALLTQFTALVAKDAILSSVHIYGSLQSLFKMHPLFDEALLNILLMDPFALILVSDTRRQSAWQASLRKRLSRRLMKSGPSEFGDPHITLDNVHRQGLLSRILFVPQMKHAQYSLLLCGIDVSLDPFPFGGGVTLCDAVGRTCPSPVPFVSSGQLQSVHRIGAGMAAHFNDSRLAYSTPDIIGKDLMTYVRAYATSAVAMTAESCNRKLRKTDDIISSDIKNSADRIAAKIYDDTASAREWNSLLIRLASVDD